MRTWNNIDKKAAAEGRALKKMGIRSRAICERAPAIKTKRKTGVTTSKKKRKPDLQIRAFGGK